MKDKETKKKSTTKEREERDRERSEKDDSVVSSEAGDIALSIEETNKLREKLGLKPLKIQTEKDKEKERQEKEIKRKEVETVSKTKDLESRLERSKNKRLLTAKIEGKSLGETIEDEDASAWVEKLRKQQTLVKEKELAAKRKKMLEEQDKGYSETNLQGLKVGHKVDDIQEGETLILTLKDAQVLDDKGNDLNAV